MLETLDRKNHQEEAKLQQLRTPSQHIAPHITVYRETRRAPVLPGTGS
jgi:hypothetical protein